MSIIITTRALAAVCNPTPAFVSPCSKAGSLSALRRRLQQLLLGGRRHRSSYLPLSPLLLRARRASARRPLFLSSSRLFYGKEGGSERTDGLRGRALDRVAVVVVRGHCMRDDVGSPLEASVSWSKFLDVRSKRGEQPRPKSVKNKDRAHSSTVLLFFSSDQFFRRFLSRNDGAVWPSRFLEEETAPRNRPLLWSLKCRHAACVFVHRVPCNGRRGRARLRRERRRRRRPDEGIGRRAERAAAASPDTRFFVVDVVAAVFVFRNFLPVFFGRLQRAAGGMGSRARNATAAAPSAVEIAAAAAALAAAARET